MSRKIILNLAISLDGYIASEDGGFDWIVGDGDKKLNTENTFDFNKFLEDIDIVVMGKKCYDQNFHNDYKEKTVYVATSHNIDDYDNIHFINNDIVSVILEEQKKEGKNIFLFGGGIVIDNFIKANVIDEYIIGIIPTILGKGRPLFLGNNPKIDLHLEEYFVSEGVIVNRYSRRNSFDNESY